MIPSTILLKQDVTEIFQRDAALHQLSHILAQLGSQDPLLLALPFRIEVIARGALGGKTEVITTITREFKRT